MKKKNFILGIIVGCILTVPIAIYGATTLYDAIEVAYDNRSSGTNMINVQDAIDELYEKANQLLPVDPNQSYPGYMIQYGSKSLNEILSIDAVPLTMKYVGHINSNGQINIGNSVSGNIVVPMGTAYGMTWYLFQNMHFDLDTYYNGNIDKLKGITTLSLSNTGYSDNTITITRWLEKGLEDENPYPGYTVKYGNKSLNEVKALGGSPLTMKYEGHINSNGQINIGNYVDGDTTVSMGTAYGVTWYLFQNMHFDLDTYYHGDVSKLEGITTLSLSGTGYSDNTVKIIRWLEPQ